MLYVYSMCPHEFILSKKSFMDSTDQADYYAARKRCPTNLVIQNIFHVYIFHGDPVFGVFQHLNLYHLLFTRKSVLQSAQRKN